MKEVMAFRIFRLLVQAAFFVLITGAVLGIPKLEYPLPILWYGTIPLSRADGAFHGMLVMISEGIFPFLPLAVIVLVSAVLGPITCGWLCPFGFVQEILSFVQAEYRRLSTPAHSSFRKMKYIILVVVLFFSITLGAYHGTDFGREYYKAMGFFAPDPYAPLDPAATLFDVLPLAVFWNLLPTAWEELGSVDPFLWFRLFILALTLVLSAYVPRFWCRYFCPLGAMMGSLGSRSLLTIKRNPLKCPKEECRLCYVHCPMQISVYTEANPTLKSPDCIKCFQCVVACPHKALKVGV